jgi:hypothetical protein
MTRRDVGNFVLGLVYLVALAFLGGALWGACQLGAVLVRRLAN